MKYERTLLLSALLSNAVFIFSNVAFGSQQCVKECDQRVLQYDDIQRRQDEFRLCYRLCSMEERNPSQNYDSGKGREEPAPEPTPPDDGHGLFGTLPGRPDDEKSKATGEKDDDKDEDSGANAPTESADTQCLENFDAEVNACEQATLKAASSCDENNSAMSNVANMAAQLTLYAGQKSAMGIRESCTKMANLAKAANAALMSYRLLCGNAITTCSTACSAQLTPKCNNGAESARLAGEARTAMAGNLSSCQGFSSKMGQASAAAQNYSEMHANSQSCALLTNGAAATAEICSTYPDYPGCANLPKMDCNNPEMAEQTVCICSKTPTNPICKRQADNQVDLPSNINSTARLKPQVQATPLRDEKKPHIITSWPTSSGGEEPVDGQQGQGANLSSPHLQPGLIKRLKAKNSKEPAVLSGFYGGGAASADKRYEKLQMEENSKTVGKQNVPTVAARNPDLARFLPGGQHYQNRFRGIAGSTESIGIDGITGPNSNIWKKIQNRYRSLQDSLHP